MNLILKKVKIVDVQSTYHQQTVDIHIKDGVIANIGTDISPDPQAEVLAFDNLHLSQGWVDLHSYLYLPGFENRESIAHFTNAAAAGGFTQVAVMPQAEPVLQTKAQVVSLLKSFEGNVVSPLVFGAVSKDLQGKELTEIYDMFLGGAVAFSDGNQPTLNAGLLTRALEYIKAFGGTIFSTANEYYLSKNGQINEGLKSNRMGLAGLPAIAEELAINNLLYILNYTQSKLHVLDVSIEKSVELIQVAKAQGLSVTASANAYNLMLSEDAIVDYDSHYKLQPPLRTEKERKALLEGVKNGVIDCITSQHNPQELDNKKTEFDKAAFGAIGFETCFAITNTSLNGAIALDKIIQLFSENPRKILGQKSNPIAVGAEADLTLFDPAKEWIFAENDIYSKSKNTPFIGTKFTGKALGIIHNKQYKIYGKN